jgi:putative protein kinase ArgK-like GTPase of G3E family
MGGAQPQPSDVALIERALRRDKLAVSTLVSLFEDQREQAIARRAAVYEQLAARRVNPSAVMLGITGTPGSGKSSLLSRVTLELLARGGELSFAV